MKPFEEPLVSVVTPVYNGEPYLTECIESVLAQTYSNWEYVIVNNFSTDKTLQIAQEYASRDKRIQVHSNDRLLEIIANHNRAFRLISPASKYCKVVSADDWLFPECLMRMVSVAEANPSVGIVGSYQLAGGGGDWHVRSDGLSYYRTVIPGREICRAHLLGTLDVFGNPTSNLYRADLVRSADEFYPNATAEADLSACFKSLQLADFGFVHQVVSFERVHNSRISATSWDLNAYLASKIRDCVTYGPHYLTASELDKRIKTLLDEYYYFLAAWAGNSRGKAFWDYHKKRLREAGYPLDTVRLIKAISLKYLNLLLDPRLAGEKLLKRLGNLRGYAGKPEGRLD
jgi:glycosyltransferase involved in cell wall biosynthesis